MEVAFPHWRRRGAHCCESLLPHRTRLQQLHHEAQRRGGVDPAGAAVADPALERQCRTGVDVGVPLRLVVVTHQRHVVQPELPRREEIPEHARLARQLANRGITVYNNTPLLGRVNDTPEDIHRLAYGCRQAGIEFHHLYVAGLPVQNVWNAENPVALYDVVDIATRVRREGSGREIPRYIIRTPLGEVDFGLSSTIVGEDRDLAVKLLPYSLAYFKGLSGDFSWPAEVREDDDGRPIIPVVGLLKTTSFALS